MPVDLFDPAEFGFQEGSPIFGYPPSARKLINELSTRIKGAYAYERFWERVLTTEEKQQLGNDMEGCYAGDPSCVNILCGLRSWVPERAVVEIAYTLSLLSPPDHEWLREVIGYAVTLRPVDESSVPSWDRETGRLVLSGELCRNVRVARATTIVPVLDAFQEAAWPPTFEYQNETADPQRIHQVVRNLNNGLTGICFSVQDRHICWHSV